MDGDPILPGFVFNTAEIGRSVFVLAADCTDDADSIRVIRAIRGRIRLLGLLTNEVPRRFIRRGAHVDRKGVRRDR